MIKAEGKGQRALRRALVLLAVLLVTTACGRSPQQVVLTVEMPLHLEDHLDAATFTELPATNGPKTDVPKPVEWRFNEPQPDWKATPQLHPSVGAATLVRIGDALRVTLTERAWSRTVRQSPGSTSTCRTGGAETGLKS